MFIPGYFGFKFKWHFSEFGTYLVNKTTIYIYIFIFYSSALLNSFTVSKFCVVPLDSPIYAIMPSVQGQLHFPCFTLKASLLFHACLLYLGLQTM